MLFKIDDIGKKESAQVDQALSHQDKCFQYISEAISEDLKLVLPKLEESTSYHLDLDSRWSLHDVVIHCIGLVGPCDMYFATYAIKQYQANLFTEMKTKGLLRSIHALCDYRLPVSDAEAHQLLQQNCESYGLKRTHAKLVCLSNDTAGVTIVSSGNFTSNTKLDVAVITMNRDISDKRIAWILKHIEDAGME